MNPTLKVWLSKVLDRSGALGLLEGVRRGTRVVIFALHRVLPAEEAPHSYNPSIVIEQDCFRAFLDWLTRNWCVLPLADLLHQPFQTSRSICSLTFDDAWEDNYRIAFPILQEFGLPATVFVPTAYVGARNSMPTERLSNLLSHVERAGIQEAWSHEFRTTILETAPPAFSTEGSYRAVLARLPFASKVRVLDALEMRFGVDTTNSSRQRINWDEAKLMLPHGITFGSHTVHHCLLEHENDLTIVDELQQSREILRQQLGDVLNVLAYPNGSYNDTVVKIAAECCYDACVTTEFGAVCSDTDIYRLPRIPIDTAVLCDREGKFSSSRARFHISRARPIRSRNSNRRVHLISEKPPRREAGDALRILFLIDELEAIHGGSEGQVLQLIKVLTNSGEHVELAILRGTQWLTEAEAGCPIHFCDIRSFASPSGMLGLWKLAGWIRSKHFDAVQTMFIEANLLGPPLARFAGVRIVLGSRRNLNYWMSRSVAVLQRISNIFATRIIANSDAVRKVVSSMEKTPEAKVDVLYNGVDVDRFAPSRNLRATTRKAFGVPANAFLVGCVSTFRPVKGLEVLIKAAVSVAQQHSEAYFMFVGDGPTLPDIERLAHEFGTDTRCVFTKTQSDVSPFLSAFDAAVLCSHSEGFSNSLLEYMAARLPIVATDVGGNGETLGNAGLLVPPKDPQALASSIVALIENEGLRERLKLAAEARVREHFDLRDTQTRVHQYFRMLAITAGSVRVTQKNATRFRLP